MRQLGKLAVACLAVMAACGDDGKSGQTPDTGGDAAGDVAEGMDATPDAAAGGRAAFQFVDDSPELRPLGGVQVWWTPPGGTRIELTSDDEGRVAFEGIDWSQGEAEILGVKSDYAPSGARVDEAFIASARFPGSESGHKYLKMTPLSAPPQVTWRGTATGMTDRTAWITLSIDDYGALTSSMVPFALRVPASGTYNWAALAWRPKPAVARGYAAEMLDFATGTIETGDEDFEASIDFAANAVTPNRVTGSFPIIESARSTLGAVGAGGLAVWARRNLSGQIGGAERLAISTDGARVEYDAAWIEPDWADLVTTAYSLTGGGEHSVAMVLGGPREGAHTTALMVPPTWQDVSQGHPIDAPLSWVTDEAEVPVVVFVVSGWGANAQLGGRWALPPGTTTFTLPADLPGGNDLFGHLKSNDLLAQIALCEIDRALSDRFCARYATSKTLSLEPAAR